MYIENFEIKYAVNESLNSGEIISLFESSGIKRPVNDAERIERMFKNSNLIISARHNNLLVGVARALTDFSFSCYLSDLAVRKEFQHKGIGKELIHLVKKEAGAESNLLLLSAPAAINYYPKTGFEKADNAFIIKREL